MSKRLALLVALATGLLTAVLHADNIAALPGAKTPGGNVTVYLRDPLSPVSAFAAGSSSFTMLEKPDGTKSYVVAFAGAQTVTVVDSSFLNPRSIGTFDLQASAAAMTPDGRRLVVAAGKVHIFDTGTDTELVPGGINVGGSQVFDVAISLDGSKAFVLGTTGSGGSQLNVIDLASNTIIPGFLGALGPDSGLSVAPNGRIYVSTVDQILEINPATPLTTPSAIIPVGAHPGRLVYTPDGKYGLAVNKIPPTGSAILLIDLGAHAVVGFVSNQGFNVLMDDLLVVNSTTAYAYSIQTQSLYTLTIGTGGALAIGAFSLGGAPSNSVSAAAISNEIAVGGVVTPKYLFIASAGNLYRVDLTIGQTTQTPLLSQQTNALVYLAPAATAGPPSTLVTYGDNQTVAPGAATLPLVVRVLDGNGKPLSGINIHFATNNPSATVFPTDATTGANGFAQTIMTGPPTTGTVAVTATAGVHTVAFTVGVGTPGTSGGIAIVAGQGQIVDESILGSPLIVKVTDLNGNPAAGVTVVFTMTNGNVSLSSGGGIDFNQASILTDPNGLAIVGFVSGTVDNGIGRTQSTITASAAGTSTVSFYVTTVPGLRRGQPAQFTFPLPGIEDKLTGQAGTIIKNAFTANVTDSLGIPIPNVSVRANSTGDPTQNPSGICNDPTGLGVLSDANGHIACDLQLNGIVGTTFISVNYGYVRDVPRVPLTITAGPPGVVRIVQGNNQGGKPGQALPGALRVQVTDAFGNLLPNQPVTWTVLTPGAVTLSNVSSSTDQTGSASAIATLGNIAGTAIVKVSSGNVSATFTLTVSIPVAGIQQVSGNGQTTLINTPFAVRLAVRVVDAQGNPVAGAQVSFTLGTGSATIGTPSATTDGSGQASTGIVAGASSGTLTIIATSAGFTTTFTLTIRLPGPQNVVFLNGASFQPGLSPGAVVTITGTGIATGIQGVISGFNILGQLPLALAGISISFNGVFAPIFYVANVNGAESVTIQVPFETPAGTVTVVINAAGGGSVTLNVQVQPLNPGVFVATYGNQLIAVAIRPDGSYVNPNNPARRDEDIRIYFTGGGQVSPPTGTNQTGVPGQNVLATLVAGLNNGGVQIVKAEYAPGLVGVYVITIHVPVDTQTGPAQPVGLFAYDGAGNQYVAASTFIPIGQ